MRFFRLDVLVAILVVALFVAAPFLVENHHHSELTQSGHCAICAFASAHMEPVSASVGVTPDVASTPRPLASDEKLVTAPRSYTRNERAPPTA